MRSSNWSRQSVLKVLHVLLWFSHPFALLFAFPFRIGASDVRMAIGLLYADPLRVRARTCALFYVTLALLKAQTVSLCLMAGVFILVAAIGLRPPAWMMQSAAILAIAAGVAFGLALLSGPVAMIYSLWVRQRVWIDMWVNDSLALDGRWPPVSDEKNNGAYVIALSFPAVVASATAVATQRFGLPLMALAVLISVGPPLLVAYRTLARAPSDCYSEL